MEDKIVENETIQAVDRALRILETVGLVNSISLAELSKKTNINKASLFRLLHTLNHNGYLSKNDKDSSYTLTLKLYDIGLNAIQNMNKLSLINSTLSDLNERCGRVARFYVEDNNQLLCLQSVGTETGSLSLFTSVGCRLPLYSTSAGKALLSAYSNDELIEKWKRMDVMPVTENTMTNCQMFVQEIGMIRKKGYALDKEESKYHLHCVGTNIMDYSNKPIGAISVIGNSLTEHEEKELSCLVLASGHRLSSILGYEFL